jgi:hypothetical protein
VPSTLYNWRNFEIFQLPWCCDDSKSSFTHVTYVVMCFIYIHSLHSSLVLSSCRNVLLNCGNILLNCGNILLNYGCWIIFPFLPCLPCYYFQCHSPYLQFLLHPLEWWINISLVSSAHLLLHSSRLRNQVPLILLVTLYILGLSVVDHTIYLHCSL